MNTTAMYLSEFLNFLDKSKWTCGRDSMIDTVVETVINSTRDTTYFLYNNERYAVTKDEVANAEIDTSSDAIDNFLSGFNQK